MSHRFLVAWEPTDTDRVIDIGCASGYNVAKLAPACKEIVGVDINAGSIAKARQQHPNITFVRCSANAVPFPDAYFDAAIMTEILEHVLDEVAALTESYRLLKPGGSLILSVPHRGLFAFLDPANQKFHLQQLLPWAYWAYVRWRIKKDPSYKQVLASGVHRHYSVSDIRTLLGRSQWGTRYRIVQIAQYGLLLGPLTASICALLAYAVGRTMARRITRPLAPLVRIESRRNFGPLSYQMALRIMKNV